MLRYEDPPSLLIMHVGGNDIGKEDTKELCVKLKTLFNWLSQLMPNTTLAWSQILSRFKWRHSENLQAMETCRTRINNSVGSYVVGCSGCYIRYPEIKANKQFLKEDGVHLSRLGNDIFLNTLQGAIEIFIKHSAPGSTFPDNQK